MPFDGAPQVGLPELSTLAAACRDHEVVTFAYESRDGTPTTRRVEPHTLITAHRRWYLVAYDLGRNAWRTFRLDRLTGPSPTSQHVPSRRLPAPDASAHLTASLASAPARYSAQATVPSDPETVRTRTGSFPSRVRALDDHACIIGLSADDPLHVAVRILTLATFGREATLQGSPELVPYMEEFANRLANAARALARPMGHGRHFHRLLSTRRRPLPVDARHPAHPHRLPRPLHHNHQVRPPPPRHPPVRRSRPRDRRPGHDLPRRPRQPRLARLRTSRLPTPRPPRHPPRPPRGRRPRRCPHRPRHPPRRRPPRRPTSNRSPTTSTPAPPGMASSSGRTTWSDSG
ncbi:WYL domain-containing protein [Streptomyces sp. NPDC001793]|uniref:helix-turn-helix transcriptional regulator n=1 Tax=Streptomyces sp. NPDC001793 TaxID=3154657 RepID=UPI00332690E9